MLSDIHGVLPALEAVLAEPDVAAASQIVLTGDIAAGPQPVPVLDRLLSLGDRVTWVRGNADRELVALARGEDVEIPDEISPWAAGQLSADLVAWLARLPHPVTLEVAASGRCCSVTARRVTMRKWCWRTPGWRSGRRSSAVWPEGVRTVVCGHTHMPFARLAHGRLIVNPGSVGMPYGRPGAHWALLSAGAVSLRRTEFDISAACAAIREQSSYPDAAQWAGYFLPAQAGDAEAIEAFRPGS